LFFMICCCDTHMFSFMSRWRHAAFEYEFSRISYEQGLRRIHSLEHYAKREYNPICSLFGIVKTYRPMRIYNCAFIKTECRVGFNNYTIWMFSRIRSESNMLILYENVPCAYLCMQAHSKDQDQDSHTLKVFLKVYGVNKNQLHFMLSYLKAIMCCDNFWMWRYDFGKYCDANLSKYRRMVLFRAK